MNHDTILARDVERHYDRTETVDDRVCDELGTDCGREIESGDASCDDVVSRRPSCCECDRAVVIAGDLAEYEATDDAEALARVQRYLDARDRRRAARRTLRAELTGGDVDPDGWQS